MFWRYLNKILKLFDIFLLISPNAEILVTNEWLTLIMCYLFLENVNLERNMFEETNTYELRKFSGYFKRDYLNISLVWIDLL